MLGKLTNTEIEEVLYNNAVGRIACSNNNQPYIVPINYVYDGAYIIAHATEGQKIDIMRNNSAVCFEVDEIVNFTNWKSVVIQGTYEEITDEKDKQEAMDKLVDKALKLKLSETAIPPHLSGKRSHPREAGHMNMVVFRILISEKTGRFEES